MAATEEKRKSIKEKIKAFYKKWIEGKLKNVNNNVDKINNIYILPNTTDTPIIANQEDINSISIEQLQTHLSHIK